MTRTLFIVACVACIAHHASAQGDAARRPETARPVDARAHDSADEPPVIPIGIDAYRQWDRWPYQRIGARAYMRSTYDRSGGNEGADASHFLYQLADDFNVALDVEGPGVLYFARYNHWHGSPWHYEVDHVDHLVRETSTATPTKPIDGSTFLPAEVFPSPLAETWSATRGADLTWAPIPFEKSFRMGYSRTHYGTGYYIYHRYVRGARLSQPLRAWDGRTPPDADVVQLLARAGSDLAPRPETSEGRRIGVRAESGTVSLGEKQTVALVRLSRAPSMLRALELSAPRDSALALGRSRLRVTWDDRPQPSIDAPVALFFGAGTLYNRDGREYLVKAFPVNIRFDERRVYLACYFPMPFFHSARIELVGPEAGEIPDIAWSVRYVPFADRPHDVGYFHATYADHPAPEAGKDLVLLDTSKTEGGGDWSGQLVGTSFIFSHRANLNTLEGDPRFSFDDSLTPQAQGTGTEEWGGGGDYWGGRTMTLPLAGHPVGAPNPKAAKNEEDQIESAYRFLLADLMPFGKNARIGLEHGGTNQSTEHYETVAYWYGLPSPSLVKTDELQIGDAASEQSHRYASPQASAPFEITSRYEWGVDHLDGKEIYPAHTDRGRSTTSTSEFTLKLEPKNFGVLLCRKLDYAFPNQRAEVFVAEDKPVLDESQREWKPAGIWYLAGSNTCVYSNPKNELGATQHIVQTSNRRFRDDEFLVPRDLTAGRSAIRLRVKFTPVAIPLFPGRPLPDLAWSEIRYTAYCFVLPNDPASALAKLSNPLEGSLLFAPAKFPKGNWHPAGLEIEDARFTAADGTHLHGWFVPHDAPRAVVLFAHGNGGNITHRADMLRALHDRMHVAVMIFDYRGYGRSDGSPDEAGILADARAARTWLAKRVAIKENEIVLFGESLGGAVAVDLAVDGARGLVLDSTFSSLPDVAAWHFPWLPVDALLQTRLDSAAKIGKYHSPLLEFHGDRDQTVPIQFGRRLFAAANEPKQFVVMAGVDHNDRRPREFFRALDRFIGALK
jgi:fermentation-respiration switch protein FrsA (DUF1100 family)